MHCLSQRSFALSSAKCIPALAVALAATLAFPSHARAADLCVDQHGRAGCSTTISAAVAAASPGDVIRVQPGIYHEDVTITIPLSLVGADRDATILDATGLANGIFIDGFDNALTNGSLDRVTISGFTIRNANFEGILANDVTHVTIFNNALLHNDQSLRASLAACPGLPVFETGDAADCGQAIHFIGAVHSSVMSNLLEDNAGGILFSDETTTSHDNVIANNQVENNPYAPGITLASHRAYISPNQPQQPGSTTYAYGLYNIVVSHNQVLHNGFGGPSPAPGIALLSLGSANRVYANAVLGNQIVGNAGAGIELHVGVAADPGAGKPDGSRNALSGNTISQNGADAGSTSTQPTGISIVGATPVVDSLVNGNSITGESVAVAFDSASTLDLHLNSFNNQQTGVANYNPAGIVEAQENWWGCSAGPGSRGCSSIVGGVAVVYDPWLTQDPICGGNDNPFGGLFAQLLQGADHHNDSDYDRYSGNDHR